MGIVIIWEDVLFELLLAKKRDHLFFQAFESFALLLG